MVVLAETTSGKGLAFVMHGLGGFKEQKHIQAMAEAFLDNGYTVVRFDTTNTIGESEGSFEDATVTNYYEDLEDAIDWAHQQRWYQEPFVLAGHSLGGMCMALYAEKHPTRVKALAPISTVVSGKLSLEAHPAAELEKWEKTGWLVRKSKSKPGVLKKLKWSHITDRIRYDLLQDAKKLKMPVLMIVGERDDTTPPRHQKILFEKLPGKKELHIISGAGHDLSREHELKELREIFLRWIRHYC